MDQFDGKGDCPLAHFDADLERRVSLLESDGKRYARDLDVLSDLVDTHAGWLNRHNVDLSSISQRIDESHTLRLNAVEKGMDEVRTIQKMHGEAIDRLAADAKVLAWKIGAILAGLTFVANQLANRIHL